MDIDAVFAEHLAVVGSCAALTSLLERSVDMAQRCLASGNKILACGNGGSAATAQHFAAELVCRFRSDRRALAGVALTADMAALTAIGNDYGYERVFARQIEALAKQGDLLFAFSTSGRSPNVVEAAIGARALGCGEIAFTGADGGKLAPLADIAIRAPSEVVARIQEVHDVCIHAIAESLEQGALAAQRP